MQVVSQITPINSPTVVEAEELGLVTIIKFIYFHAGYSRELEVENQNPSSPTTKVYVVLKDHGLYVANAVEDSARLNGIWLTHLQKVESVEGFLKQISREVDRTEEGKAFLLSAWSLI